MSNTFFRFQQFVVSQELCAMKVGTDGVLLGAWTDVQGAERILDVGSDTGLISLMCAQRNSETRIVAIDLNQSAYTQTVVNIGNSVFKNRIEAYCTSLQEFAESSNVLFDVVVCNPPFFVDALKSPDAKRNMARHADALPLEDLFAASSRLLSPAGKLSLIYPAQGEENVCEQSVRNGLFLRRKTTVIPAPNKSPKRILLEFCSTETSDVVCDSLMIEEARHSYSKDFRNLVQGFYLHL